MFYVFKIKKIIAVVLVVVGLCIALGALVVGLDKVQAGSKSVLDFTIVLDAGHGGRDGGTEGVTTGVKESDLNLIITKKLAQSLRGFGFNVVLTRHDENGLYGVFSRDYKLEDMTKRKEIIQKHNANMVISIHMNSFPAKQYRGAQAFYDNINQSGMLLANSIQNEFLKYLPEARKQPSSGDFYILKCTQNPSVMIECGFLSNEEEEALLVTEAYQNELVYTIFSGIISYFKQIQ